MLVNACFLERKGKQGIRWFNRLRLKMLELGASSPCEYGPLEGLGKSIGSSGSLSMESAHGCIAIDSIFG